MASAQATAGPSGTRKAAILVVLLGDKVAAPLLQQLSRREVARIAREVAELGTVEPALAEQVLEEYYLRALAGPPDQGGPDVARRLLAQAAMSPELVDQLIGEADASGEALGPLLEAPPDILARALRDEHPQTTALVLLYLPPRRAAQLLAALPEELRTETVLRMATLKQVRGEVLGEVATSLQERLAAHKGQETEDGLGRTVTVLSRMPRADAKRVLDEMERDHPKEVEEMRSRLFTFESLKQADDRGLQELLRQIDSGKLALALAGADGPLAARFLGNLSDRAAGMLKEEMEYLGTPAPKEQAPVRREILDLALKLEAEGSLIFAAPEEGSEHGAD